MLRFEPTAQFRRDVKRAIRRGYDMAGLEAVVSLLLAESSLPQRYRDHALSGDYAGFRECHIEPDWLLIYYKDQGRLVLVAQRTGTHSDLFDQ